jgi:hypothetical protein
VSACFNGLPTASQALLLDVLGDNSCFETSCKEECGAPAPAKKKTGDACGSDAECSSGTCNDWCVDSCTYNTDCGINSSGKLVWCVSSAAGTNMCFPGCNTTSDCAAYPGATCQATTATNGASTKVCAY